MRAVATLVVALLTAVLLPAPAAQAATPPMPGDFTGYAFDTCEAPSQKKMDAWRRHSKYAGVGIYIAGRNRACPEQEQLTPRWVRKQSGKGWQLLPLVVGRQAACAPKQRYDGKRIAKDPDNSYAQARRQGRAEARAGVEAARRLGIGKRSVLWFDLEDFDVSKTHCRRSALAFVSGWTAQLHDRGYRSGLYSSAGSGIIAVDNARRLSPGSYKLPDYLWIAEWDRREDVRSSYIDEDGWWPHRRVKQYRGDQHERHVGVRIHIDSNVVDTGQGTVGGRAAPSCGVELDHRRYLRLSRGDRGDQVKAAQCLLRQKDVYAGKVDGRYSKATAKAARRFQERHGLRRTGEMDPRTWTALHAVGARPLLKYGSGGNAVRRLQRALNAARSGDLRVDGIFAQAEHRAVKRYQRERGRGTSGVVTAELWRQLQRGKL